MRAARGPGRVQLLCSGYAYLLLLAATACTRSARADEARSTAAGLVGSDGRNLHVQAPAAGDVHIRTAPGGPGRVLINGVDVLARLEALEQSMLRSRCVAAGSEWVLAASFEQPRALSMANLTADMYEQYFTKSPIWIQGNAQGLPRGGPAYNDGSFHVESRDWRCLMYNGSAYQLRQEVQADGAVLFDLQFDFVYNGHVLQDTGPTLAQRAWVLQNRTELVSDPHLSWSTSWQNETIRFWLPFTSATAGWSEDVYLGDFGFMVGRSPGCGEPGHRCGNAGIIDESQDARDVGAAWAPHLHVHARPGHDIVYLHGNTDTLGSTSGAAGPIVLRYWIRTRPVP